MGILTNMKRKREIKRISGILGDSTMPTVEELFSEYSLRDEATDRLFDIVESEPQLRSIIDAIPINREQLQSLYKRLVSVGAGQWVNNHYVPVSTFLHPKSLSYLLKNRNTDSFQEVSFNLIMYFEKK